MKTLQLLDTRLDATWNEANPDAARHILAALSSPGEQDDESADSNPGSARQMEARMGHDTWDRLSQIRQPVFCCGGTHDGIAPMENMRRLAKRIPNAELEFFEGGHIFLQQDPRAWEKIIQFLEAD